MYLNSESAHSCNYRLSASYLFIVPVFPYLCTHICVHVLVNWRAFSQSRQRENTESRQDCVDYDVISHLSLFGFDL
jgi:hypothetical protein